MRRKFPTMFALLPAVCVLWLLAGCSGDDSSTSPSNGNWGDDRVKFEVEWKPETVRFDNADMKDLVNIDTANQVFTFRTSNTKTSQLEVGKILVVNDYTIRRVTNVTTGGGQTVVRTEEAAFTDAVTNADIDWDYGIDFKPANFIQGLRSKGVEVQQITTDSINFSITIGDWSYAVNMKLNNDDANISLVATKGKGGLKVVTCSLIGVLQRFRSKGTILIKDGQLQKFTTKNTDVDGNFTVKVAAIGSGNDLNLQIPLTIVKFPVPELPFIAFTIKALVVMNAVVPPDGSTLLEANFKYTLDQGLEFDRKNLVVLPILDIKKREFDKTQQQPHTGASSPVAMSWGLAFPRYEVSLFTSTLAWVQPSYLIGGDYTPFPACQQAKARFIGACGWSLGILGASGFSGSKTLWDQEKVLLKAGACN